MLIAHISTGERGMGGGGDGPHWPSKGDGAREQIYPHHHRPFHQMGHCRAITKQAVHGGGCSSRLQIVHVWDGP